MKKGFFILFCITTGAISLFAYNLIRVSKGYGGRVSDEDLKNALVMNDPAGQNSFQAVLAKMVEGESQPQPTKSTPDIGEPTNSVQREVASQSPAGQSEPHQLTTQEVFSQLRDRIDGRMVADQNVLLGLMSRLQIVSEPTPEVSDFVLSEMISFRAKKVFEDKGMAARYLQAAAVVYMQSTADGDRVSESMLRVVAQQEDPELRRILTLTYLERNQDRRDGFLKQLEAKGVTNALNPPPPAPVQIPSSEAQPGEDPG
ncbi:MAG: hypothetical protein AABZ55_10485 [Bdellovibrionota bacterium]